MEVGDGGSNEPKQAEAKQSGRGFLSRKSGFSMREILGCYGSMTTPPHKRHTVDESRCAGSTGERKIWSCFFQSAWGTEKWVGEEERDSGVALKGKTS